MAYSAKQSQKFYNYTRTQKLYKALERSGKMPLQAVQTLHSATWFLDLVLSSVDNMQNFYEQNFVMVYTLYAFLYASEQE